MKPIFRAENETIDELIRILKESLIAEKGLTSVYIFGSVAKHEEQPDSDVDVLMVSDDPENASYAISKAQEEVVAVFNKQLSPLIFREREVHSKKKSDLVNSITSDHILVLGKELFLNELKHPKPIGVKGSLRRRAIYEDVDRH